MKDDDNRIAIAAEALSLRYPEGTEALLPASFTVNTGDLVFLTGPSGSGKTSLLQLFIGMLRPTGGTLHVLGRNMGAVGTGELRHLRQSIGPVFQDFRLVPGRTALENVMAGSRFLSGSPRHIRADAQEALERVGLAGKTRSFVEHLSWGERQRVSIARAVARNPRLILADEPTGNLDKENALHILSLLASFRNRETTVVITTHATHLIAGCLPDAVLQLDHGVLRLSEVKAGMLAPIGMQAGDADRPGGNKDGMRQSEPKAGEGHAR